MNLAQQIHKKLNTIFAPSFLEVIDETHLHHGHPGVDTSRSSHFRVFINAKCFASLTKLEIHRKINEALKLELANSIHALAIEILK
ncbi:BolA family protein [Bartonella sp. TP]|uniref:BolA family protein n=1 Tax=Bartonella sp. TP TaxID=3057550 RepID=UPI0025B277CD|nr:BolA family protein [Bartonella sp. TP]WJW79521.1 BolA family protein [Bartonella sp. TP]